MIKKLLGLAIVLIFIAMIGTVQAIPSNATFNSPNLTLYMTANGTAGSMSFSDVSQYHRVMTAAGNVNISNSPVEYGSGSVLFNGTGLTTGITTPITKDDAIASNRPWSIRFSMYPKNVEQEASTTQSDLFYAGDYPNRWVVVMDQPGAGGTNNFYFGISSTPIVSYSKYNFTLNSWYDITIGKDNGQNWYMNVRNSTYNVTVRATSSATITPSGGGGGVTIGNIYNTNNFVFNGYIDDFEEFNGTAFDGTIPITSEYLSNPTAAFSVNSTSGSSPLPIQISDLTLGNAPTSYSYRLTNVTGNNTEIAPFSTSASPLVTLGVGNWSINQTVTNPFGTSMSYGFVNVTQSTAAPVSSFTPSGVITGTSPVTVSFIDTSTNNPTYWNWSYQGYGTNTTTGKNWSTVQNITSVFTTGNFSISHGAGNSAGFNLSTQITWINITNPSPIVSFTANVTSGLIPLVVAFNDTSTGNMTSRFWNFGDVTNSTDASPVKTYSTAGTYTVNLTETNLDVSNSTTKTINVYNPANSQFSSFNTAGTAPFSTYLYDLSTNTTPGTDTWYWMFGDGNTSTAQSLYYTWNITGTYAINHSFSNGVSTSWINKSAYIVVGTPTPPVVAPVASFYGGPQIGAPPLLVYLTDVSSNTPTSWNWSFGDGTYGITQNPSHWYNSSGFFTVGLTATNTAGSNTTSQNNFIMVY